jgi:hypothetical protein
MARRLKTLTDIRRYLASLINRVEDGSLNPAIAGRLGYLANLLKGAITEAELETRVSQLEALLKGKP